MDIQFITKKFDKMGKLTDKTRFLHLPVWGLVDGFTMSQYEVDGETYYLLEGGMGIDAYTALLREEEGTDQLSLVAEAGWAPDCGDDILYAPKEEQIEFLLTKCKVS